jgi:hypothetical protein
MDLQGMKSWRDAAAVLLMMLCMSTHAATRQQAIQEARKLNEQALQLFEQGDYQSATPLAQRAGVQGRREGPGDCSYLRR